MLFKMNITDTHKCTFCELFNESIEHLMCKCAYSYIFWKEIKEWLENFRIKLEPLNDFNIIFGILDHEHLAG